MLVNELRSDAAVSSYLTSVLAFINCLIVSHDNINERVRIRNELIGTRTPLSMRNRICNENATSVFISFAKKVM